MGWELQTENLPEKQGSQYYIDLFMKYFLLL